MADDEASDNLSEFIHAEQKAILQSRVKEVKSLNSKAANLMRLLGVVFTFYSAAILLAVRLSVNPDSDLTFEIYLNEYTGMSILFLAAAFLYALLAYHRTTISKGPSAVYLHNQLSDDSATVKSVQTEISEKMTGWVKNNDNEIKRDHTRLFNCTMCIFFSLTYIAGGTLVAEDITEWGVSNHLSAATLVAVATYLIYDHIRYRARTDA